MKAEGDAFGFFLVQAILSWMAHASDMCEIEKFLDDRFENVEGAWTLIPIGERELAIWDLQVKHPDATHFIGRFPTGSKRVRQEL